MKKFNRILFAALLSGIMLWGSSCKDDKDENSTATLSLTAPAGDQSYDLAAVASVAFTWNVSGGAVNGGYQLLLSLAEGLTQPQTIDAENTSVSISASDLDAKLAALGVAVGESRKIYWSVRAKTATDVETPKARAIILKRISYNIVLQTPAEGANVPAGAVTFSWTATPELLSYVIRFATSEAGLESSAVQYEGNAAGSYEIAGAAEFDALLEALGIARERNTTVWWTIIPAAAGNDEIVSKRSFSTRREAATIFLSEPADGISINTYITADPEFTFTWTPVAEVNEYTLKLSASDQFPSETTIEIAAGGTGSYTLSSDDKTTLMTALTQIGHPTDIYWTVTPATAVAGVLTQIRSCYIIGGESDFPYRLNDSYNVDDWTATAVYNSSIAGNVHLYETSAGWVSGTTWGYIRDELQDVAWIEIDMLSVKTVKKIMVRNQERCKEIDVKIKTDDGWSEPIHRFTYGASDPCNPAYGGNYCNQFFELETPVETRYVRLEVVSVFPGTEYTEMFTVGAFWAYGSNN
jgi:outer membrane murein-binding lipoprotein Lpp